MSIAAVEDAIIEAAQSRFVVDGKRLLKAVESLPAQWDDKTFDRLLRGAPGVFVCFVGGPAIDGEARCQATFVVMAVTTHASGELARRRGDKLQIGAYQILEILVPLLHDRVVPGIGTLKFADIANLFTDDIDAQGAVVYGSTFSIDMPIQSGDQPSDLADFLTFDGSFDLARPDGRIDGRDVVSLPPQETP